MFEAPMTHLQWLIVMTARVIIVRHQLFTQSITMYKWYYSVQVIFFIVPFHNRYTVLFVMHQNIHHTLTQTCTNVHVCGTRAMYHNIIYLLMGIFLSL